MPRLEAVHKKIKQGNSVLKRIAVQGKDMFLQQRLHSKSSTFEKGLNMLMSSMRRRREQASSSLLVQMLYQLRAQSIERCTAG